MKIKNISEPQEFFKKIKECKGTVELLTTEGDRLNMKSKLCQYIALTQVFKDKTIGIELVLSEPEEIAKLVPYLVKD